MRRLVTDPLTGHLLDRGRATYAVPDALRAFIVTRDMRQRKGIMDERSDAFLSLPGGIGTLEEILEVFTWLQLGLHLKPVGLLNADGYYDTMLEFLAHSVRDGFMGEWQMGLVRVGQEAAPLLRELVQAAGFNPPPHPEWL